MAEDDGDSHHTLEALEEVLERHETLHSADYRRQREEAAPA
jgi:hypothetical protein